MPAPSNLPHRHYGLDWLRIGAFGLLILYHVGMYFAGWRWIVKTAEPIGWLAYPMLALTPWRLDLLFVVSGYASFEALNKFRNPTQPSMLSSIEPFDCLPRQALRMNFVVTRRSRDAPVETRAGTRRFAKTRTLRLLIPLLFAYVMLLPPELWVRVSQNHGNTGPLGIFWLHDYYGIHQIGRVTLPSAEHLWFVAYLWAYTMILCVAVALATPRLRERLADMLAWLGEGPRMLWVPVVLLMIDRLGLMFVAADRNGLFTDWAGHALYLPMFLAGYGLAATPALWSAIDRLWRPALFAALAGYLIVAAVESFYPGDTVPPHMTMMIERAARTTTAWGAILFLLRTADRFWNRDHPWRAPLADAVFPAYIVHHVAIVLIGWWIAPLLLPHATEFAILLAGTLAACLIAVAAGRAVPVFGRLIGMHGVARAARSARTPAHSATG